MDYNNGKIYKIVSNQTDKVYYGSTCSPLFKRLYQHKVNYKSYQNGKYCNTTSFEIVKYDDCEIILVEKFPCESKEELYARERYYIENNNCVNKIVIGRTKSQWYNDNKETIKEQRKQYREDNKETIKEQQKQWYNDNKEQIKEQKKQWYNDNKETIKEQKKQWYNDNKEQIKQYQHDNKETIKEQKKQWYEENKEKLKTIFNCECGGHCAYENKSKHFKSNKHINFLKSE